MVGIWVYVGKLREGEFVELKLYTTDLTVKIYARRKVPSRFYPRRTTYRTFRLWGRGSLRDGLEWLRKEYNLTDREIEEIYEKILNTLRRLSHRFNSISTSTSSRILSLIKLTTQCSETEHIDGK